ncbi:hypothetical protein ABBQ32_002502 [Trebouxia sp. C0010 RCD-2024]
MSQSIGLLLVALHNFRFLKKLKLDFAAFSSYNRALELHLLSADALMALDCLWRQMEDFLVANGSIRRVKLIEPACTTEQASSLTAAAAKGYQRLKDDTAAGLLLAMTGRSLQSRLLNQLPTQVFDTIVLNALPATPCLVECIQIHAAKLERWA